MTKEIILAIIIVLIVAWMSWHGHRTEGTIHKGDLMVYLDVYAIWSKTKTLIRSIDVTDEKAERISDIIKEQRKLIENCDCIVRQSPDVQPTQ